MCVCVCVRVRVRVFVRACLPACGGGMEGAGWLTDGVSRGISGVVRGSRRLIYPMIQSGLVQGSSGPPSEMDVSMT